MPEHRAQNAASDFIATGTHRQTAAARTQHVGHFFVSDNGCREAARFTDEAPDKEGFTNVFAQTWQSHTTPAESKHSSIV